MKIEVNVDKRYFLILLGAVLLLGIVGIGYAFGGNSPSVVGHSVGEIDWNDQIQGDINVRDSVRLGSSLYVGGQRTITDDGASILVGDIVGGDGQRGLILKAGDNNRVTITAAGDVGIGVDNTGSYGGKKSKVDVDGYFAARDVWLKDSGRWAGATGVSLYGCPIITGSCQGNPSTCEGIGTVSTCKRFYSVGGAACGAETINCPYLGRLLP